MNVFPRVSLCALLLSALLPLAGTTRQAEAAEPTVDFNRDIRSLLSNNCFQCHGPDEAERKGGTDGLRLDFAANATADLGGYAAIVPGKPEQSELISRITSDDPDLRMPPTGSGRSLSPQEIELLRRWIAQGADYARHWSYTKPVKSPLPAVKQADWPTHPLDHFILARLEAEGLAPAPQADRHTLIRRVTLDLTGLPPTPAEVAEFVNDPAPDAYEKLVDRLLARPAFGEHWARMWLDLARYADSAGYADDPPRTIWAYRDYVIRAFNQNRRFDQFTIEQLAGDLLPDPTDEQLIATAFHRNTLTNNEGGTNDEEFRNVAIVDRVNTTMAAWMGTTMACAQCHSHKFDPITQTEYFQMFALLNHTQDADRRDESPLLEIWTDEQRKQEAAWKAEIATLEKTTTTLTPELAEAMQKWAARLSAPLQWHTLAPAEMTSRGKAQLTPADDHSILATRGDATDVYTLEFPADNLPTAPLTAVRLEALTDASLPGNGPGHAGGNFVLTGVRAEIHPPDSASLAGRTIRIELPGKQKMISLAEVQVFSAAQNIAPKGKATQSSTDYDGPAHLAIDGNTNGDYNAAKSTTHTAVSDNPWWEVDLGSPQPLERIVIWNRTDNNLQSRLDGFRVIVLDAQRKEVWQQQIAKAPQKDLALPLDGVRSVSFAAAYADHSQSGFSADSVIAPPAAGKKPAETGWAIAPQTGKPHQLTLIPAAPIQLDSGAKLVITLEQLSKHEFHTLGKMRIAAAVDARASELAALPAGVISALQTPEAKRNASQSNTLREHYLSIAPALKAERGKLASLKKQLANLKPYTTVPVMRELDPKSARTTKLQYRGNWLDTGPVVEAGLPSAFHTPPEEGPINRLTLARWLIDPDNPLTARVMVNRFWEKLFGIGIVRTSEEFGSQGERPSHPRLLDWLAVEFMESGWDIKHTLKLLVTSSTYRQSSKVTPELFELDPDNRLLARGPRFRLTAEMIRDQALFVSGLLSEKMYGPPVRPRQPNMGLNAAFGSGIDWKTSAGEDQYRRGLYTMWRRSNPYPSMSAFDAPNREVCTVRRDRTNTPLQALVTLNDPVYVEAAQSLARRIARSGGSLEDRIDFAFRLCLARPAGDQEQQTLAALYQRALDRYSADTAQAKAMATDPLGPAPENSDLADLAAWTVVSNVLLNLDEMFLKR